jgi:hypothetical protein
VDDRSDFESEACWRVADVTVGLPDNLGTTAHTEDYHAMMDQATAGRQVFAESQAAIKDLWVEVDTYLTDRGLHRDVKTIYVSYTDNDMNLVAAVHPDPSTHTFEVALAISESDSKDLYDATHLKWRTLPVAVRVGDAGGLTPDAIQPFLDQAIESVAAVRPRDPMDFSR